VSTLDNLKKEAKHWLKACRAGDAAARARLAAAYPQATAEPALRDVQHALAREHGFESWKAFTAAAIARAAAADPLQSLLRAAEQGDVARLTAILDAQPDLVSRRGELEGHTGFRSALHFGIHHQPVVELLLARGADPNVRDDGDNAIPLHFAAEGNDLPVIRLLIEHGSDPIGDGDMHELQVIGWATCFGRADREVVDYLLAHGARHTIFSAVATGEVDAIAPIVAAAPAELTRHMDRTNLRRTPLHLAIVKKQPAALAALLALGADTTIADADGVTPLDQAALDGETAMIEALLAHGAAVTLPAAVALDRAADIERLLRDDPDALRPGHRWATLIVRAAATASGTVIDALVRHGADVNAIGDPATSVDETHGFTALHFAAFHGNASAVTALLAHGANPNLRESKYGSAAAGWADYANQLAVRDLILDGPIDLFQAIGHDRLDRIADIVARDPGALTRTYRAYAPPNVPDRDHVPELDHTPLDAARAHGRTEAVRILEGYGRAG
jgi:ankyrin repeat protein